MQWKMARPGRFADRFNRWALRRGFPALAWLAPRISRRFLEVGARAVIDVVMGLHHRPKRAIARNLGRVLGRDPHSREVRRAVREMLHNFSFAWADLFRNAQLPPEQVDELVESRLGFERVEALRQEDRPIILLTAHLGNWELGGVVLGQHRWPVSVVYVQDQFAEAERFRSRWRGCGAVEEIAIRPHEPFSGLRALSALRAGRLVALQGDRDFDDRGVEMEFFGGRVRFPSGPFHLARATGAAVVPTFLIYTPERRLAVDCRVPIEVSRELDAEVAIAAAVRQWVDVLEEVVRTWPTQWYTFYDFWPTAVAGEA